MAYRIFVAGAHGQVARALAECYAARGDEIRCHGRNTLDIRERAAVSAAVADFAPHLIVNAAAYTKVDLAEDEPDQAFAVNRDGAGNLAASARSVGAPIIHISTDYVFDGLKSGAYREEDSTNPLSVYGMSKLAGELAVARETDRYVILRTSWVCSPGNSNFVRTMLHLAAERSEIRVVNDQWGAPTFAADLAAAIARIGDVLLSNDGRATHWGIYHSTSRGETTWYGLACATMDGSSARGGPACKVIPIASSEYPSRAPRPANSRLDCTKLFETFGIKLPHWSDSLEFCLDQIFARDS